MGYSVELQNLAVVVVCGVLTRYASSVLWLLPHAGSCVVQGLRAWQLHAAGCQAMLALYPAACCRLAAFLLGWLHQVVPLPGHCQNGGGGHVGRWLLTGVDR